MQFAAVAVRPSQRATAALVRIHHWTIPVAYDVDGAVGDLYDVEICPMVELAYRGGIVADRLIGDHWLTAQRAARLACGRCSPAAAVSDEDPSSEPRPGSSSPRYARSFRVSASTG